MLKLEPKTHVDLYEEASFLEFPLPGEADLQQDDDAIADERDRYDDQIIAALVCP